MNKKQLSLQNSSLFAELERKAKEIEILSIRLEEAEEKLSDINLENEELKVFVEELNKENRDFKEKIEQLENDLAIAEIKAAQSVSARNSEPDSNCNESEDTNTPSVELEAKDIAEEIFEKFFDSSSTNNTENEFAAVTEKNEENFARTIENQANNGTSTIIANDEEFVPPSTKEATATECSSANTAALNTATTDLLRDYGARIIGKVTRVTAEVLSKINAVNNDASESLKTLALGKNESFKFQIMELAKKNGDPQKIMTEMDFLAEEAIVYLRSI